MPLMCHGYKEFVQYFQIVYRRLPAESMNIT